MEAHMAFLYEAAEEVVKRPQRWADQPAVPAS